LVLLADQGFLRGFLETVWPKSLFSWHCLLISMMAAVLLLVNPLTARVLPLRYSVRKGFGRYLAMLVL
jgi:hypothetical protein